MYINLHSSGSHGNLYTIHDGKSGIVIDPGLPIAAIKKKIGFRLSDFNSCLISHYHKDHCKGIDGIIRNGIDCFASMETIETCNISGHRVHAMNIKKTYHMDSFAVMAFETQHDCPGSIGFLIKSKYTGKKLLYATDTYYLKYKFKDINYFMIECNYSHDILMENLADGTIDPARKDRILSSHFSLENLKKFFLENDLSKCEQIYLIHISSQNGDPGLFKHEIRKVTGKPVVSI